MFGSELNSHDTKWGRRGISWYIRASNFGVITPIDMLQIIEFEQILLTIQGVSKNIGDKRFHFK